MSGGSAPTKPLERMQDLRSCMPGPPDNRLEYQEGCADPSESRLKRLNSPGIEAGRDEMVACLYLAGRECRRSRRRRCRRFCHLVGICGNSRGRNARFFDEVEQPKITTAEFANHPVRPSSLAKRLTR